MADTPVPNFEVRQATAADVEHLACFIQAFVEEKRLLPRTLDELESLVKHCFVAISHGKIVGCAALEVYSRKLAELRSLAVDSNMRGQGIGKALVTRCVERAKELQILEVMAITSSDEFFKACGFDFTLPGEKKALFMQTRPL